MIQKLALHQAPPLAAPQVRRAVEAPPAGPSDTVALGPDRRAEVAEDASRPDGSWTRLIALSLIGVAGLGVAGCSAGQVPVPAPVQQQPQEAVNPALDASFANLDKTVRQSRGGHFGDQAEAVARGVLDAVAQNGGHGLQDALRRHPAVTLTVATVVGPEATGVSLSRLDLPTNQGLGAIADAMESHPLVAGLLTNAASGPIANVLTDYAKAEAAPAAVPDTPASFTLTQVLDRLEAEGGNARETLTPAVRAYLATAGTSAEEVRAMLMDHPEVSAALVATSGTEAQPLMEAAGVPANVARVAARVLAEEGPSQVGDTLAEHPFSARALSGALASGAVASLK